MNADSLQGGVKMIVLGVNRTSRMQWCQVLSNGRKYTCPTKEVDGKLYFIFKKVWHPVADFISETADELVEENGKFFWRPFTK